MKDTLRVGVVGSGAISDTYLENMINRQPVLEVKGICSAHIENAQKKAEKYGLPACTTDEMLADPEIDLVVILTPVETHFDLIKKALLAGKHVYTEKTMTVTLEEAKELMALADEKGLLLCSAPDTFLGKGLQTARKVIDDGILGDIYSFSIACNRCNDILTAFFPFLRAPGAGALRDYMVYYLTALLSLLGPADRVSAFVEAPVKSRMNNVPGSRNFGEMIATPNESVIAATLRLKSGVVGTIHENNESLLVDRSDFIIYGTKGILLLGDPNQFESPVKLLSNGEGFSMKEEILPPVDGGVGRGIGPADMAKAILEGRTPRASKELAGHVLEVIEAMEESAAEGTVVTLKTTFEKPAAL